MRTTQDTAPPGGAGARHTAGLQPISQALRELALRLIERDWLTDVAFALTLGCLGSAILDSYTSLCLVGGSVGHIGSASACFGWDGWDTRLYPIAVDAGWAGALFALWRLARSAGLRSWRWWAVLAFDIVGAVLTIGGNAFHGALAEGALTHLSSVETLLITCAASAVPGVMAVGAGLTLSVLYSLRSPSLRPTSLQGASSARRGRDLTELRDATAGDRPGAPRPETASGRPVALRNTTQGRGVGERNSKAAAIRALLVQERPVLVANGRAAASARAALIRRVAQQTKVSQAYVRRIADEIEHEARRQEPPVMDTGFGLPRGGQDTAASPRPAPEGMTTGSSEEGQR